MITKDEFGSSTLHLVEPAADKDRNEIASSDYVIKEIDLGRTSTTRVVEDFKGSSLAMKEKMQKMKEKM